MNLLTLLREAFGGRLTVTDSRTTIDRTVPFKVDASKVGESSFIEWAVRQGLTVTTRSGFQYVTDHIRENQFSKIKEGDIVITKNYGRAVAMQDVYGSKSLNPFKIEETEDVVGLHFWGIARVHIKAANLPAAHEDEHYKNRPIKGLLKYVGFPGAGGRRNRRYLAAMNTAASVKHADKLIFEY